MELLYSEVQDGIAPSANYTFFVEADENLRLNGLILQAVLFENGGSSGELSYAKRMKDKRYGEKLQFMKGKKILSEILMSSKLDSSSKLKKFKSELQSLALTEDKSENEEVKSGKHFGKQRLLNIIQEIETKNQAVGVEDFESDGDKIKDKLEKWTSKL